MASTRVHVILTGIVSLIPDSNTPPQMWTIRLHDERTHPQHPHVPSILVERSNLASAPAPDRSNPMGTLDAWLLDNGSIEIKSKIVGSAISSSRPLPYVLSIEEGCGGVTNCPIAKPFQGVSMAITQGIIEATELEGGMWQWDASSAPATWIAEEVCWQFEIDGSELEIWLPHQGGTLVLKVVAPSGGTPTKGGDIELRLQNTMDMDVFPLYGPPKPGIDQHAPLYFDQASANPSQPPVLREYKPTGTVPVLPDHMHRLADYKIGTFPPMSRGPLTKREHRQLENLKMRILRKGNPGLRVNCPPAQWNGQ